MKLLTEVKNDQIGIRICLKDKIMVLGSCFADNIGAHMSDAGFNVCVNPFGTLYNPASVLSAMQRLETGEPFSLADCAEMGAGAGLVCSFSHHTTFARPGAEDFLAVANSRLAEASAFWKTCNKVIITLGTAFVWERRDGGGIVSNCLKRPASEFTHRMLSLDETASLLQQMSGFGKQIIFTVSPIRHLGDGAHANTLSKATLHLAVEHLTQTHQGCDCAYFPAYEILADELRDYRFYAEDLVHPSPAAISYIWEKFIEAAVPSSDQADIKVNEKASRHARHRSLRQEA